MQERIICAAVRFKKKVWYGHRHFHAQEAMRDELSYTMTRKKMIDQQAGREQGFVTSTGRFVSRLEAMDIALSAGQVVKGSTQRVTMLFSEDLY